MVSNRAVIGYLSIERKLQIYRISKPSQAGVNFTDVIEFPVVGSLYCASLIDQSHRFLLVRLDHLMSFPLELHPMESSL